jgi:hypothetical protein
VRARGPAAGAPGDAAGEVLQVSNVYRQVVSIEIIWTEDGHRRDWGTIVRDAVLGADWPGWPGADNVSDVQDLTVADEGSAAAESELGQLREAAREVLGDGDLADAMDLLRAALRGTAR